LEKREKEIFIDDMKGRLEKAQATFLVTYQGLDVEAMKSIRKELRKVNAEFRVVKNRLAKLASRNTQTECIRDHFVGPCALMITYQDVVSSAKVLVEQNKKSERLKLRVGQIAGKALSVDDIKRLAELPSREVLLAQVLSAMQAVPTSLVRALNGVVMNLLYALKSIERQKGEGGNQ
jgi:large subunit ribosomal protein L10